MNWIFLISHVLFKGYTYNYIEILLNGYGFTIKAKFISILNGHFLKIILNVVNKFQHNTGLYQTHFKNSFNLSTINPSFNFLNEILYKLSRTFDVITLDFKYNFFVLLFYCFVVFL